MKSLFTLFNGIALLLCSLAGRADVEIAAYDVLYKGDKDNIELRNYPQLVLVSTAMGEGRNSAFYRLFRYISGENTRRAEIAMTAPVFMGNTPAGSGEKVAMTAPVLMAGTGSDRAMSFVLPASYTEDTAPLPNDSSVTLHAVKDYTVAAIRFSGFLNRRSVDKHKAILERWISKQGYRIIGEHLSAGYNPPYTVPFLRRNEVLIPVQRTE